MTSPQDAGSLQFDSVVPRTSAASDTAASSSCTLCQTALDREYFDVNGQHICRGCSEKVTYQASTPRDMGTLVRAGAAGVGAAILGAIVYFAVLAISGYEVGLVAIAIGYMVGYGVRLGTRGRGGRRFQVLALVLTYWAIGLAYSSLAIQQMIQERSTGASASLSGPQTSGAPSDAEPAAQAAAADGEEAPMTGGQFALGMLQILAFTLVLPVLVIAGSLPGSLLSAAIIVFGMLQAWKMTAAPAVTVSGPYRIGATPAAG
jgi:hypothetical protein